MIEAKQKLLGWKFVFLSADLDALADAVRDGIHANSARLYSKTPQGTLDAWTALSSGISDVRTGKSQDIDFQPDPSGNSGPNPATGS